MTEYILSVVQLCPDTYRSAANDIAEAYGYGPGNLSVQLADGENNVWWGCHAWWLPSALEVAVNPPDEVPGIADILVHVVTSAREHPNPTGDEAQQHWMEALAASGLTVIEPAP